MSDSESESEADEAGSDEEQRTARTGGKRKPKHANAKPGEDKEEDEDKKQDKSEPSPSRFCEVVVSGLIVCGVWWAEEQALGVFEHETWGLLPFFLIVFLSCPPPPLPVLRLCLFTFFFLFIAEVCVDLIVTSLTTDNEEQQKENIAWKWKEGSNLLALLDLAIEFYTLNSLIFQCMYERTGCVALN